VEWVNLIFSAAGGGVLGLFGAGVKMFAEHKKREQNFKHELLMQVQINANMKLETERMTLKGEMDLDLQESAADSAGLQAAMRAEQAATGTSWWVNDIKALMRPLLTLLLVIAAFIKPSEDDLVWMASTAVTFWFGDRPRKS